MFIRAFEALTSGQFFSNSEARMPLDLFRWARERRCELLRVAPNLNTALVLMPSMINVLITSTAWHPTGPCGSLQRTICNLLDSYPPQMATSETIVPSHQLPVELINKIATYIHAFPSREERRQAYVALFQVSSIYRAVFIPNVFERIILRSPDKAYKLQVLIEGNPGLLSHAKRLTISARGHGLRSAKPWILSGVSDVVLGNILRSFASGGKLQKLDLLIALDWNQFPRDTPISSALALQDWITHNHRLPAFHVARSTNVPRSVIQSWMSVTHRLTLERVHFEILDRINPELAPISTSTIESLEWRALPFALMKSVLIPTPMFSSLRTLKLWMGYRPYASGQEVSQVLNPQADSLEEMSLVSVITSMMEQDDHSEFRTLELEPFPRLRHLEIVSCLGADYEGRDEVRGIIAHEANLEGALQGLRLQSRALAAIKYLTIRFEVGDSLHTLLSPLPPGNTTFPPQYRLPSNVSFRLQTDRNGSPIWRSSTL
ncbi:hypothetical protein CC2G_013570 [Coprinopsis cinerea AmutBmut pab1-1]|nr:hypothetical protein CC2G_013570 [Coprinopsis cinerea AmutBmut pab1-1]